MKLFQLANLFRVDPQWLRNEKLTEKTNVPENEMNRAETPRAYTRLIVYRQATFSSWSAA